MSGKARSTITAETAERPHTTFPRYEVRAKMSSDRAFDSSINSFFSSLFHCGHDVDRTYLEGVLLLITG